MLYRPGGDLLGSISADFRLRRGPTSIYEVLPKVSSSGHITAAVHAQFPTPDLCIVTYATIRNIFI
jgi:hypothetical protein